MASTENIQVALRFRPFNQRELQDAEQKIWSTTPTKVVLNEEPQTQLLAEKRINVPVMTYDYNNVFTEQATNEEVYHDQVRPVVMAS